MANPLVESAVDHLAAIKTKMKDENLPELAIQSFVYYYKQLIGGETGLIPEQAIQSVTTLPDLEKLGEHYRGAGQQQLPRTVMLKLNGGLGTGMGLQRAKSLLPVREGLSFLDVIAKQAIHWNIPLVLMNSFSTAKDSQEHLAPYNELRKDVSLDFIQHKVPKIAQEDFSPISWKANPALEWCPPGHGDIYTALVTTGMLDELRASGFEYLFVSNGDNLGARLDLSLLGYFSEHKLPFMMEVADRTEADRKGGHLAFNNEEQLLLRESAQCPDADTASFQDIERHKYFNTNNLWIHLGALEQLLKEKEGILGLPMIRNSKTADPRDPASPSVYQLETAMGAAIAVFEGAGAIRVPRSRFAPVKTTSQLLVVQSDAYVMKEDFSLELHEGRQGKPCVVELDSAYYKTIDQLQQHFPEGPPSLVECDVLKVTGDVVWGKGVKCMGKVHVRNTSGNTMFIENERVLSGSLDL